MKYRLQPLLIVTISLLILSLLVIQGIVLSYSISGMISEKIYDMSVELLEQKNLRLEERISEIKDISLSIAINKEISGILENVDRDDFYQQIRGTKSISTILSNIADSRDDISRIFIVTDLMAIYNYANVNGLIEKSQVKDASFYESVERKNEGVIATSTNFILNESSDEYVASFFRKLQSSDNRELGILCIVLNDRTLRILLQETSGVNSKRMTFILTSENRVISPFIRDVPDLSGLLNENGTSFSLLPDRRMLNTVRIDGEKQLAIVTSPNSFQWRIVQFIPYSEIDQGIGVILQKTLFIGLVCITLTVIILYFFSQGITRPIKGLIRQMGVVGTGSFDVSIQKEGIVEIEELNTGFAKMTQQIQNLLNDINREHQNIRRAEFTALQAQINPHFLYNTLDLINWMAIDRGAHDISGIVSELGNLFRLGLNKGKDMTSVRNEIEHVRCYMKIQNRLTGNKIAFIEEYEPVIFSLNTIKLILQPLIENSCIHGLNGLKGRGEIRVTGSTNDEGLFFVVKDNGSGVDPEYMNFCLTVKDGEISKGSGIRNVNDRIRMQFGGNYGIQFLPVSKGSAVMVHLPLIPLDGV